MKRPMDMQTNPAKESSPAKDHLKPAFGPASIPKMDKAQISSLDELLEMAQIEGVELIVCRMTLDMMEIDESELIEGSIGQIRGSPPREREAQGQNIRQIL